MSTPSSKGTSQAQRGSKSKSSKVVILKLDPTKLDGFVTTSEEPLKQKQPAKSTSTKSESSSSTPADVVSKTSSPSSEIKPELKVETPSAESTSLQVPIDGRKKGGVKAGTKRPASAMYDGQPKPRAKPGPKKRKLDGLQGVEETGRPWTTPAPITGHKLGPKANQGAINAGLRALDRTGTPCRKWSKAQFSVKSFTGIVWSLPTWGAPRRVKLNEHKGEDGQSGTPTSNSENQPPNEGSNAGSDSIPINGTDGNIAASSPTPITATAVPV